MKFLFNWRISREIKPKWYFNCSNNPIRLFNIPPDLPDRNHDLIKCINPHCLRVSMFHCAYDPLFFIHKSSVFSLAGSKGLVNYTVLENTMLSLIHQICSLKLMFLMWVTCSHNWSRPCCVLKVTITDTRSCVYI